MPFRPTGSFLSAALAGAALLALAACGSGTATLVRDTSTTWSYEASSKSLVRPATGESIAPRALLEQGRAQAREGQADAAIDAFRGIHGSPVEAPLKTEALLEEARVLVAADRRDEGHAAYLELFDRYPQSPLLPGALREAFANAFAYAGQSMAAGVQAVRDLLNRFPREDFSAEQAFALGELFFRAQENEVASAEFDVVRREYPRTPWAEAALYRIALCAFRRFRGIDYDARPLVEARRHLEKFLLDYPSSSLAGEAKRTLDEVKGLQALKTLAVADYYDDRGRLRAARFMYESTAKDYPGTESAARAQAVLQDYPPPEPEEE
jgi:outer membrane assembly lipoprotein YfiO